MKLSVCMNNEDNEMPLKLLIMHTIMLYIAKESELRRAGSESVQW